MVWEGWLKLNILRTPALKFSLLFLFICLLAIKSICLFKNQFKPCHMKGTFVFIEHVSLYIYLVNLPIVISSIPLRIATHKDAFKPRVPSSEVEIIPS